MYGSPWGTHLKFSKALKDPFMTVNYDHLDKKMVCGVCFLSFLFNFLDF